MKSPNKSVTSSLDELDRIYLAAARNEELSQHSVKETPENIALYWRLIAAAREISNSGNALQIPN